MIFILMGLGIIPNNCSLYALLSITTSCPQTRSLIWRRILGNLSDMINGDGEECIVLAAY